jgi:heterodisulfide reductase subunit C
MFLFLQMNAADTLLQKRNIQPYQGAWTGDFIVSSLFHPLMNHLSTELLVATERIYWWLHILGILAFMNYLSRSKHLHIILAFPNSYYASSASSGTIQNMPSIQREVLLSMNPGSVEVTENETPSSFGAKDIQDLSWKNILDAYSCTECGRCSAACPATLTGKKLSPRKIMMATRDRAEEIGKEISSGKSVGQDSKSLLYDYITEEELRACTTCQACIEECPIGIRPMDIIVELRRYLVMEKSSVPGSWASMFTNTESNFAPWKFSPDQRDEWNKG